MISFAFRFLSLIASCMIFSMGSFLMFASTIFKEIMSGIPLAAPPCWPSISLSISIFRIDEWIWETRELWWEIDYCVLFLGWCSLLGQFLLGDHFHIEIRAPWAKDWDWFDRLFRPTFRLTFPFWVDVFTIDVLLSGLSSRDAEKFLAMCSRLNWFNGLEYQKESERPACKSWERSMFCGFQLVHTFCDTQISLLSLPDFRSHEFTPSLGSRGLLDDFAYSLNLALPLAET